MEVRILLVVIIAGLMECRQARHHHKAAALALRKNSPQHISRAVSISIDREKLFGVDDGYGNEIRKALEEEYAAMQCNDDTVLTLREEILKIHQAQIRNNGWITYHSGRFRRGLNDVESFTPVSATSSDQLRNNPNPPINLATTLTPNGGSCPNHINKDSSAIIKQIKCNVLNFYMTQETYTSEENQLGFSDVAKILHDLAGKLLVPGLQPSAHVQFTELYDDLICKVNHTKFPGKNSAADGDAKELFMDHTSALAHVHRNFYEIQENTTHDCFQDLLNLLKDISNTMSVTTACNTDLYDGHVKQLLWSNGAKDPCMKKLILAIDNFPTDTSTQKCSFLMIKALNDTKEKMDTIFDNKSSELSFNEILHTLNGLYTELGWILTKRIYVAAKCPIDYPKNARQVEQTFSDGMRKGIDLWQRELDDYGCSHVNFA